MKEHAFSTLEFQEAASERGKSRRRFCYQIFPGGNSHDSDWLLLCHVSDCIEILNADWSTLIHVTFEFPENMSMDHVDYNNRRLLDVHWMDHISYSRWLDEVLKCQMLGC